ncbi:hypothetical protein ACKKBG_A35060 [Auxenochlorella protothecoides x Auxenochlorella symbiontica]
MSAGFLGFMTEGISTALAFRHLEGGPRVRAIQRHGWVQVASTVCIALGFLVIYTNKANNGKQHFTSLHGKVGNINTWLAVATPVGGIFSFRKLGLITRLPEPWHPFIKWLHRCLGLLTWMLALVTVQLVLPHKAIMQGLLSRLWQLAVVAMGAVMLTALRRKPLSAQHALPTVEMALPVSKNR